MMRLQLVSAAFLIVLVACSDSTKPVGPASVASISLAPATIGISKGTTQPVKLTAKDSSGNEVRVDADWTSSAPSVARVSNEGVISGASFGSATITATVGTRKAFAEVVVTAVPTTKAYAVLDLGVAGGPRDPSVGFRRRLSDSGDVLVGATLYRNGVAKSLSGCGSGLSINGPGHVLCKVDSYDSVSSYAIWHDGILTPLAASDTFKAQHFRAFALSDSDEVPGLFFMPSFSNAKCPANGARCLSLWNNGAVTFPGYDAGGRDVMQINNHEQIVVEYAMWNESDAYGTIFDIATTSSRRVPYGVALNDNGWGAVASPWIAHGSADPFRSTASVLTPDTLITLGSGAATGINDANVAVGTLDVGPFIWRGEGVSLLTHASVDPAWTITAANEINNRGQILATADNSDGRKAHVVILTPTQP
jgi:hypothetical protein